MNSVREINAACSKNYNGSQVQVYAMVGGKKQRITRSKTVKGKLLVHVLSTGEWKIPEKVFTD